MTMNEIVVEKILERMEAADREGKPFRWIKGWDGQPEAVNYWTGLPYRGINRLTLDRGEYITYTQLMKWKAKNDPEDKVHIKKGCHKHTIFFYTRVAKKDKDGNDIVDSMGRPVDTIVLRFYQAYNICDIENLPPHFGTTYVEHTATEDTEKLERYVDAFARATNLEIDLSGKDAYYNIIGHSVSVPPKTSFKSQYNYYQTMLHELSHSTGCKEGLDRFPSGITIFGSESYCKEELVAEIAAAQLAYMFRLVDDELENNTAYIAGWSKYLKDHKGEILSAAKKADEAVTYFVEQAEKQMLRDMLEERTSAFLVMDGGSYYIEEMDDEEYVVCLIDRYDRQIDGWNVKKDDLTDFLYKKLSDMDISVDDTDILNEELTRSYYLDVVSATEADAKGIEIEK